MAQDEEVQSHPQDQEHSLPPNAIPVLLCSVFLIAICGLLYELLISTLSSYFQGSSVLHFSLVIGLFLSFMGVGSFLSQYMKRELLAWFIAIEMVLSLIGGISAFILYAAFSLTPYFYGVAFILIACLGILIGLEIPILTRVVRRFESLSQAMAKVLSFDYLGALVASIIFPLLLLPQLGTMRTAFVVGLLNLGVAQINLSLFKAKLKRYAMLQGAAIVMFICLGAGFIYSFQLVGFFEQFLYRDEILYTRQTPYQRIVVTQWNQDLRLYLNGNIQFSSRDEYRYHEPLVHIPAAWSLHKPEKVLVLGGGDGLVAREVLKYESVTEIVVVDLDPAVTHLAQRHPAFLKLNERAMLDPKVSVVNKDAYQYVEKSSEFFDLVLIDLPDPHDESIGKLYSNTFYQLLSKRVSVGGVVVTQASSPYFAPKVFWCVHETLAEVFSEVSPYHVQVPAFGEWGFVMARQGQHLPSRAISQADTTQAKEAAPLEYLQAKLAPFDYKYLNIELLPALFSFDNDMRVNEVEANRLDNQIIMDYYQQSWDNWR